MLRGHLDGHVRNIRRLIFLTTLLLIPTAAASGQHEDRTTIHKPYSSHFRVDVLVAGRPLPEYHARGKTYVEALPNVDYEVRITNPLPDRVAVALSVDGLNSIDARRTSAWNASKWVIAPYSTIHIRGWQMSSSRARRFFFTTERDSYGAKLGKTQNIGVISAVFFRERTQGPIPITPGSSSRSEESSRSKQRDGRSADREALGAARRPEPSELGDDAATGIGHSVTNNVHWVHLNLDSRAASEVTIRYEYYHTLVRLGVLPRGKSPDHIQRRERATGFEPGSFSPEP